MHFLDGKFLQSATAGLVFLINMMIVQYAIGDELRGDGHSYSNPLEVRVTHIDLDLDVDFNAKVLTGTATLDFMRVDAKAGKLRLDAKNLTIESVVSGHKDRPRLEFALSAPDKIKGSQLSIDLPEGVERVVIRYQTGAHATALQWVNAEGTTGRKKPFLFTQSEAINARTWIPLQDTPGVRTTYSAKIRVPEGFMAVMSAKLGGVRRLEDPQGGKTLEYSFLMPQAIPSYLIALAVGDLTFGELGPRSGVYAEPGVVKRAVAEFQDVEQMIASAEALFGAYRWERYDILVLPPSFPFGGMENPRLTFATPTIIAGDRSLVSLVAHELAHSWSGNLVTNATWRDFWLNEGFTVYFERRIIEKVYGKPRADMEAVLGLQDLKGEIERLPAADQILYIDLEGRDPDDAVTDVAYEKGALFLSTIEHAVGRDAFDRFLSSYFSHFAFQSITTEQFLEYLHKNLFDRYPRETKGLDLDGWVFKPGLPKEHFEPNSELLDTVDQFASRWLGGTAGDGELRVKSANWSTQEWLRFLKDLPKDVSKERMSLLDYACKLSERSNAEIACLWLELSIVSHYEPGLAKLEPFLTSVGRRKFLVPLYRTLVKTDRTRAQAIYAKARQGYHPIAVDTIDQLVGKP